MLKWQISDVMQYLKPLHCFEKTKESVGKKSLKKLLHITTILTHSKKTVN